MTTPPPVLSAIRDGKLRAIALASPRRHPSLPDVPTTAEAGLPGVAAVPWFAVFAPGATPAPLRARLAEDIAAAQAATRGQLEGLGLTIEVMGAEALGALVLRERERLGEVVRAANIRVE
jgi:tripartite-type tricarboxylate transporter receptor subunit TctC